jgi:hypothetical protein
MWSIMSSTTLSILVSIFSLLTIAAPETVSAPNPDGTMTLAGRMRSSRAAATSTAIGGDRVLIAGGMTEGGGALHTFELFDATAGRIVATGDMSESRMDHSATRLPDGRVLVIGGFNGSYLKTAEIFDPRAGRFTAAGSMHFGRSGHTATLLRDGTVLIVGGVGDGWSFLPSAELYNSATGQFALVKPMSVARESHTATMLQDGRVLITGGHRDRRENITVYASTEIYDPTARAFNAGPPLTTARHKHEAAPLADGRVLVFGGSLPRDGARFNSAEAYDPASNRFTPVATMAIARFKFRDTAVRLRDGRILVAGSGRFAELFDPASNSFSRVKGDLDDGYSFASAVLLSNGDALVLGGYNERMRNTDGIWRYRP